MGLLVTILSLSLVLILAVLPFGVSVFLYRRYFGSRYTTKEALAYRLEDFPGLMREKYEFPSNKGQLLTGYRYYRESETVKGVVVIAHGLGGGHNSYMDCANYFTQHGYDVFAYDVTGNDESEGSSVNGLPQGVIDLHYTISFLESQEVFQELPIMLFGHSWGGYSVCNVLNQHPEVKAVVSMAGFNRSSDMIQSGGESFVGKFINVLLPYIRLYETVRFGKYATQTAMDGFAHSNAAVFVIHSGNDDVVPKKFGYDIYYKTYGDSPRFLFLSDPEKGHNRLYYSDAAITYLNRFNSDFADRFQASGEELTPEKWAEYVREHLDRSVWANLLDEELFGQFVAFYDAHLS